MRLLPIVIVSRIEDDKETLSRTRIGWVCQNCITRFFNVSGFTSCCLAPCFLEEVPLSDTCRTVILHVLSILDTTGCRRRVSPAVCDSANQSHQFLRPRHTTDTTDHYVQKNPFEQQYPSNPVPRNCQKLHDHNFHQGRRGWSQRGQREGQELDNRMCFDHVKSGNWKWTPAKNKNKKIKKMPC